jgi:DNA polymerase III alpha subunit (gram-positive type)
LPENKKISQELYNLKDDLVNNKLKNVNFDTLDLTDIVNEENSDYKNELSPSDNGKSIEELVKEILKPELKKWLNDNLPTIVKQLVDKEIKKIIPKNE